MENMCWSKLGRKSFQLILYLQYPLKKFEIRMGIDGKKWQTTGAAIIWRSLVQADS